MATISLTPGHQALLQVLLAGKSITDTEIQSHFSAITQQRGQFSDSPTHAFKVINRSLKTMNFEVRSMATPENNELVHCVVNLENDDVAKVHGTR